MVACLSVSIPIWIHNGYQFWVPRVAAGHPGHHRTPGKKEVCFFLFSLPSSFFLHNHQTSVISEVIHEVLVGAVAPYPTHIPDNHDTHVNMYSF